MVRPPQRSHLFRIKLTTWMTGVITGLVGILLLWFMINGTVGVAKISPLSTNSFSPTVLQATSMTLPTPIFQQWLHSREEDAGGVRVYRPMDYPFPPARGREGLEFRQDGTFIVYQIAPTDGNRAVEGLWQLQDNNRVQIEFPQSPNQNHGLTILECSDQLLKVQDIP
ncbi:MAG: hypothetical protein KTR27_22260 [Leptolyngbyaceae cyanobacterium MAG.088]|nr:hypothetical protein [Leptolyngbyaceae cyanobacterium MAG.088]